MSWIQDWHSDSFSARNSYCLWFSRRYMMAKQNCTMGRKISKLEEEKSLAQC